MDIGYCFNVYKSDFRKSQIGFCKNILKYK